MPLKLFLTTTKSQTKDPGHHTINSVERGNIVTRISAVSEASSLISDLNQLFQSYFMTVYRTQTTSYLIKEELLFITEQKYRIYLLTLP